MTQRKKKPTRNLALPFVEIDLKDHPHRNLEWLKGFGITKSRLYAEIMIMNINTRSMRVRLYEDINDKTAFASNLELGLNVVVQDIIRVVIK